MGVHTPKKQGGPDAGRRLRAAAVAAVEGVDVADLRERFGLTRPKFARLGGFSDRAVAGWEAGERLSAPTRQRMNELDRLYQALAAVIDPATVGRWFQAPNPAFGDQTPLEVVERGESDRLWRMISHLEAGEPS